jgi:acetyl esterase
VLDPEIQRILDDINALRGPGLDTVPVAQMRAAHDAETAQLAGDGPDVAEVVDGSVPGPGGPIPVRTYRPDGARGTVAYFHGGGWVVGNLDSVDAVCRALALASGAAVASVDYRLAPEHPYPAAVEDALAAARALRADVVAGDSAGGNLAAVVARRLEGLALQVLIYPVTDAGVNTPSYREFGSEHGLTAGLMARFWELYLGGADGAHPDASPLRASDLAGAAPAYVLTADHDVLRDEGEAYAKALSDAGVPVQLVRRAGTIHGFWRWQATSALARATVRDVGAAIRAALDA